MNFADLPDLPQSAALRDVAERLWQDASVQALWVGGSLARGEADTYSDVDLRVAVRPEAFPAWQQPDMITLFSGQCIGHNRLDGFGNDAMLHHLLLRNGVIFDLWIQTVDREVSEYPLLLLAGRDAALEARLQRVSPPPLTRKTSIDPAELQRTLTQFWIDTFKHQKVLFRRLHLLAIFGVQLNRALLQRLWYIEATDQDSESGRSQTIHSLSHQARTVEQVCGLEAFRLLGGPLTSREEICGAIEQIRDAVTASGRRLAARYSFDYPEELETTVRRHWEVFRNAEAQASDSLGTCEAGPTEVYSTPEQD